MKIIFIILFLFNVFSAYSSIVKDDPPPPPSPPPSPTPKNDNYKVNSVKNLESIVLKQLPPQENSSYDKFYANDVELEPITIIYCGGVDDTAGDSKGKYLEVDRTEALKNTIVFVDNTVALDKKYDVNNTIPIIDTKLPLNYLQKDPKEPDLSIKEADKRSILLLYTDNSDYVEAYKKEGFKLGGVYVRPQNVANSSDSYGFPGDVNDCHPTAPLGVGETVVHAYLLATGGLGDTSLIKVSVLSRDRNGHIASNGPLTYSLVSKPNLTKDDFGVDDSEINQSLNYTGAFYSYFSTEFEKEVGDASQSYLEELRGAVPCSINFGANFHGLHYYTDEKDKCDVMANMCQDKKEIADAKCSIDFDNTCEGNQEKQACIDSCTTTDPTKKDACVATCTSSIINCLVQLKKDCSEAKANATPYCESISATSPPVGELDCDTAFCERRIDVSSIYSKRIPLHDLGASVVRVGAMCPSSSGGMHAFYVLKPLYKSVEDKKDVMEIDKTGKIIYDNKDFYNSFNGGVGAYYYIRDFNTNEVVDESKVDSYGGMNHYFYYFSYIAGDSGTGPSASCKATSPMHLHGHDIFGNIIDMNFIPAIGDDAGNIKSVS